MNFLSDIPPGGISAEAGQDLSAAGKKLMLALLLALLTIVFVCVLYRNTSAAGAVDLNLLLNPEGLLIFLGLSTFYIYAKAFSLFLCVRWVGGKESLFTCFKIFCQSVFMEITLFPSKLAGDAYKYAVLRDLAGQDRLLAIGLFRTGPVLVLAMMGIVLLAYYHPSYAAVFLACLPLLFLCCRRRLGGLLRWPCSRIAETGWRGALRNLVLLVFLNLLATMVWSVQSFWIAGMVSNVAIPFWSFLAAFLLANTLGALSNLPFGIGVKDASLSLYLHTFLSARELVAALLLMRISGELCTGLVGWALFLGDFAKKKVCPPAATIQKGSSLSGASAEIHART
jgi:hypothetical protein